ncbi:PREDICTED: mediator of RNA polymerase II transcription subunit 20 isoform X1 [Haliaeetus leucocephalus]|uniref:mediator of RNA polymerase II transcription subunit 20 isoform X1 n=1 Tax=Haliaeetus leucocephalus TaxID=52644 RepID=UPI00053CB589|nr:PREDICTED: mediator of RNA polymerase II transcription subunit 20 isoform X1 [Haliaeetus leucocephalus]
MGVTCVAQVPVAEGKSLQQTVEILTRKLELLGAEKQGTFCVDCETYHTAASTISSQGQTGKLMYVMHNSEYPLSCFALFENGPCLIADANFDILMVKLKGFFQNAKANKIESRGTRYQYCDFLVKVGTVTMGPSARGISVETQPQESRALLSQVLLTQCRDGLLLTRVLLAGVSPTLWRANLDCCTVGLKPAIKQLPLFLLSAVTADEAREHRLPAADGCFMGWRLG